MQFKEDLPDQCPPGNASNKALENVCRFIFFNPPEAEQNYLSHAELGKPTGNATECDARSCSLFKLSHAARQAMKIGAFKNARVAVLNIPENSGAHCDGKKGHINFWQADHFSPASAINSVHDSAIYISEDVSDG